jgi:serine/threonine-protein kinase
VWPFSLSRDGNTLFFGQYIDASSATDIGMLSMENEERTPKLLLHEEFIERRPQISPDGQWLAYESNESGQFEIFVRPFPDVESGGKWQVSTNGGLTPLWSPDGKELFYRSDDTIMTVSVDTDPTFRLGTPKSLFTGPYRLWDISPDGKQFLLIKITETTDIESAQRGPNKINIVTNWFEELKQRVPVD